MSGNKQAAEKRRITMEKRYGKDLQKLQREWGSKGGKKAIAAGGGFASHTFEQRSRAGKAGYQAMLASSRKGKK